MTADEAGAAGFGALLKQYRLAAGLSQEALAERARLSPQAISVLERGLRQAPYRDTVDLLVEALGLTRQEAAALEAAVPRRRGPLAVVPHPSAQEPLPQAQLAQPAALEASGAVPITPAATQPAYGSFLGAVPVGPLVGRQRELQRVLAALDAVAGGQGRLVLLTGEPGVGKTRLAQEVMLEAQVRGVRVLTGRCYEQYNSLPFFPFIEALTGALTLASPTLRREAPRRFPYLGLLLPNLIASPPAREGEDLRLHILRTVGGFLVALAAEAPVALLLDDLHWADSAGLELLLHLARQMHGGRVLVLGTYRDMEVGHQHPLEGTLAELVRERLVTEISLRRLPPEGTAALIGAHFGLEEVSDELRDLVHSRAEGNPFFTEEILKALVEQGAIFPAATGWDRQAIGEIAVPRSVRAVVGQRVGRLSPGAQEVLRIASVLGQEWELPELLTAVGQDEETVLQHLDAVLDAGLVEERWAGRRVRYAFVHALIGQTLYEEIARHRLRKLHLRVAEALERVSNGRPEGAAAVARHFLAAGKDGRAFHYVLRAGDHAAALFAHAEAIQHYEAALDLVEEGRDGQRAALVREKLGRELAVTGRSGMALTLLEQAATVWRTTGDVEGLGRVTAGISIIQCGQGMPEQAIERLQALLPMVEARGPSADLALMYGALVQHLYGAGRYVEALKMVEHALDLAEANGNVLMVLHDMLARADLLGSLERIAEALRSVEAVIPLAEQANDPDVLSRALSNAAHMYIYLGQLPKAQQLAARSVEVAERGADLLWLFWGLYLLGRTHLHLGEWSLAGRELARALAVSRDAGESDNFAWALQGAGNLCLVEGRWEEAVSHLEAAIADAVRNGDLLALRLASGTLAEVEIRQGHPEAARARLLPLLDRPGLQEIYVMLLLPALAWAQLELDEIAEAERTIEQALRRARAQDMRLVLVEALRVQVLILIRRDMLQDAERIVHEGVGLAREMPNPYAEARLLQVYGTLLARRGEVEPACGRFQEALAIFQRLGARKDSEQVRQDLAALQRPMG
jgi:tetratricopeptide (TPR) repeat protein/transcriptional regulator with XRE-family HTH domain